MPAHEHHPAHPTPPLPACEHWCALQEAPLDLGRVYQFLECPAAGGQAVFAGTVRNHNHGAAVEYLAYEAYVPMALAMLHTLAEHLARQYEPLKIVLIHRLGPIAIGEAAVVVGISAVHRDAAFRACREGIDRLKLEIPIWKQEIFVGGARWVDNCAGCAASAGDYAEHLHAHPEHTPLLSIERDGILQSPA